ncbi:MAG: 1-deoxy-D-xylulose-5-phosphate reductoisomerase [Deltaproteobacteria bacterium]|nr:1-deoxy-D-xylulose-5-phosphate reductoisomerase [Deltaproteobacteria bacterium]
MKNISILGSTGSIGVNALDVIKSNQSRFRVVALSACRNISLLNTQIKQFRPKVVSVVDKEHARKLEKMIDPAAGTQILFGSDGYREVAAIKEANMVISAMVGSAGLIPTMAALEAGKDIALANKETMVMAGDIIVKNAKKMGVTILPVDSEHSAIFQCLSGNRHADINRIILTASGGPFLNIAQDELANVKPEHALRHPNWQMGPKITIDSASMMNKGLEVIEAKHFFSVDIDRIEVQIHPQSIIHSMVEYVDGSVIAQLGVPDMRIPIAYALSYPERLRRTGPFLDLLKVGRFDFFCPDLKKFPSLKLAYDAGRAGGTMPAVLNAANEVAVTLFLKEAVRFTDMPKLIGEVLSCHQMKGTPDIHDILEADRWARERANKIAERMSVTS